MTQHSSGRESLVLLMTASSALVSVFLVMRPDSSTNSTPFMLEIYETGGWPIFGEQQFVRARHRLRRNDVGHIVAHGLQRLYRPSGTLSAQQEIWDARLVGDRFKLPGRFGKLQRFPRESKNDMSLADLLDLIHDETSFSDFELEARFSPGTELTLMVVKGLEIPIKITASKDMKIPRRHGSVVRVERIGSTYLPIKVSKGKIDDDP